MLFLKSDMEKIKILIADDHQVVRKGIITLLEDEPSIEVVGEAANGLEVLEKLKTLDAHIVLLDISMPELNGIDTANIIEKKFKKVRTIIFSMHHNEDYIIKSIENGAHGYLLKDTSREELLTSIQQVASGEKNFNQQISNTLLEALANKPKKEAQKKAAIKISKKEKEILSNLVNGMNSREIAEKLGLSIRTVDNHRAHIIEENRRQKCSRTGEARHSRKHGLTHIVAHRSHPYPCAI